MPSGSDIYIIPVMAIEDRRGKETLRGRTQLEGLYLDLLTHTQVITNLTRGVKLDDWNHDYAETFYCNSLGSLLMGGFESAALGQEPEPWHDPSYLSPNSASHVKLMQATRAEFESIGWRKMRLLMGGEEGLQVPNPERPITPEEFPGYLASATGDELELFRLNSAPTNESLVDSSVTALIVKLAPYGLQPINLLSRHTKVQEDERFREMVQAASIHKLGCILAAVEQHTFEQAAQGKPIDRAFIPIDISQKTAEGYTSKFGEPLPSIADLYQKSHSLLFSLADVNDPLIGYLSTLNHL